MEWDRVLVSVVIGLLSLKSSLGHAQSKTRSQLASEDEQGDSASERAEQTKPESKARSANSTVIPKVLRGRGYTLRTQDADFRLNSQNRIELEDEWSVMGELLDKDGRIVDRGFVIPGDALSLRPNLWSLSLNFASTRPLVSSAWNKALLPSKFPEGAIELQYRASRFWNAWLSWGGHTIHKIYDENLTLDYDSATVLVGVSREFAPWGHQRGTLLLRSLQIAGIFAVGAQTSVYRLSDEYVQIRDKSEGPVFALGAEFRLPVLHDFWIFARGMGRVAKVEVRELDANEFVLFNSTSWGVSYAF